MSIMETPHESAKRTPMNRAEFTAAPTTTTTRTAGKLIAVLRIAMGLLFGWAFLDKLFGLGYATTSTNAWINGGSPTKGFLSGVDHGPFQTMFTNWAGQTWADWLFMLGLAAISAALLAGIGLRITAVAGTLMLLLMWAADWPPARHTSTGELTRSTNPILDDHIIYALILITLAALSAGAVWGLGTRWANLDIVRRNRWLI